MTNETSILTPPPAPTGAADEAVRARWARLAADFVRLPLIDAAAHATRCNSDAPTAPVPVAFSVRDVGELLLEGHDSALADAERYVAEGHTIRTGQLVEFDDIDDHVALARWSAELERASARGWAPPAPAGFWASFLRWRTPLGMARLTERRVRTRITPVPPSKA
jgi:hypothetical protein